MFDLILKCLACGKPSSYVVADYGADAMAAEGGNILPGISNASEDAATWHMWPNLLYCFRHRGSIC